MSHLVAYISIQSKTKVSLGVTLLPCLCMVSKIIPKYNKHVVGPAAFSSTNRAPPNYHICNCPSENQLSPHPDHQDIMIHNRTQNENSNLVGHVQKISPCI